MPKSIEHPTDRTQVRPDYLTMSVPGIALSEIVDLVCGAVGVGREHVEVESRERGALGWTGTWILSIGGRVAATALHGGASQRGRVRVEFKGEFCAAVNDWQHVRLWMKHHDARITRVDLCLDLLSGEYDLSVALNAWKHGQFQNGPGRKPTISQLGNWIEQGGKGRTLYIGSRASGKMWRIYEKGKQLGDALSKWVRWELELRNEGREIPHDVVTKCAEYLVGAAPVMARIVKAAAEKIRAVRAEGTIMLDHAMNHCRKSYGKLIQYLRLSGASPEDVLISLSRPLGDRLPRWGVQAALAPVDHIRGLALLHR